MSAIQQMLLAEATTTAGVTYATWDPVNTGAGATLSGGNLTVTNPASAGLTISTLGKSSGKWYWEGVRNAGGSEGRFGISNASVTLTNYLGADINGWAYRETTGQIINNAGVVTTVDTSSVGDVIGFALDMGAGTLTLYKSNISQGVVVSGLIGTIYAAAGSNNAGDNITINFGATALTYTPPAGFNAGLYV